MEFGILNNMRKFILVLVVLGAVGAGAYFRYSSHSKMAQIINLTPTPLATTDQTSNQPDAIFTQPIVFDSLSKDFAGPGFAIRYPDGFKVTDEPGNNKQDVVTVEDKNGSGFQIFSFPFDEPGALTSDRIHQDLPDTVINDPRDAKLDNTQALVFDGNDDTMGATFEVWVVHSGRLYQVTGPKTATDLISQTLNTWKWK